jgi:GDP-L-fucose synthase
MFDSKTVLVTGGTGMIGRPLVDMLLARGTRVLVASLDEPSRAPAGVEFRRCDLRFFDQCLDACQGVDYVFNLVGIKGSPAMTSRKPASFFVPTLQFSINMMEAARRQGVARYLFVSSVGVYQPAEVFREDDVWKTFPSPNDRFAGWAKRMGELQAEAYRIEYGWEAISIVRPANVYGPWDNFDPENAMVIPSLVRRASEGENPLVVWGDGSQIRDFIHARDCARGILQVFEQGIREPVNLGSGTGITIREVVETLVSCLDPQPKVVWDTSKPAGDARRVMDTSRAESHGIHPTISLAEGIRETLEWYRANRQANAGRYNSFTEFPGRETAR